MTGKVYSVLQLQLISMPIYIFDLPKAMVICLILLVYCMSIKVSVHFISNNKEVNNSSYIHINCWIVSFIDSAPSL